MSGGPVSGGPVSSVTVSGGPVSSSPVRQGRVSRLRDRPAWLQVAGAMFAVGWGANQFVSLLIAYRLHRGLSVGTSQALFGVYALGLIPALLLGGPASDACGRARVVRPAAALSLVATVVLMLGTASTPALYVGRFLAGVVSGVMFAAGTAWVKELSVAPYDDADAQAGARRAAIALSAGFGLGPVVAGVISQFAPAPLVTPYLAHLVIGVLLLPGVWLAPETVAAGAGGPGFLRRLRVPSAGLRRFRRVVAPEAPWVFGSAAVAFAVLPGLVEGHVGHLAVLFSAACAGVTLAVGVLIQPTGRRLVARSARAGPLTGLGAAVAGTLVAALGAGLRNWPLVLAACVLLGVTYGLTLVAGLYEVQRLAPPGELAGLTGVFYALTYIGFAVPYVLAQLHRFFAYPTLLLAMTVLAVLTLAAVLTGATEPA